MSHNMENSPEEMTKAAEEAFDDMFFRFTMAAAGALMDSGDDSQTKVARIARAYKEIVLKGLDDEAEKRKEIERFNLTATWLLK